MYKRQDGWRIFERGTGSTLPMPCCEDDDDDYYTHYTLLLLFHYYFIVIKTFSVRYKIFMLPMMKAPTVSTFQVCQSFVEFAFL